MDTQKIPIKKILCRILCFLLITVFLLVILIFGAMFVICKGPSETAAGIFVRSVRETSAIYFLADIFFSEEELAEFDKKADVAFEDTDTSKIIIQTSDKNKTDEPAADPWGHIDADGDGLLYEEIHGSTYTGYMLTVLDPSRVVLGCNPNSGKGYTVQEYVEMNDAVAGINGGGFADENGQGDGSQPDTAYVHNGEVYFEGLGVGRGFIGIDKDGILHVGIDSIEAVRKNNIMEGTGFGPVLVVNGTIVDEEVLQSGLNPRTAIGQRSDGAILLLVVDGRQPNSLGASYTDLAEIMYRFGAVNACNLDGGSSTLMWYNGEYVNNCASVIGIRTIPTSFVVLKKEAEHDAS